MIVLALIVAAGLLLVIVLGCLAFCWNEPVRRGGQVVDLSGARPKTRGRR